MWFPCLGKWLTMDKNSASLSSEREEDKETAEERWKKERREKGVFHIFLSRKKRTIDGGRKKFAFIYSNIAVNTHDSPTSKLQTDLFFTKTKSSINLNHTPLYKQGRPTCTASDFLPTSTTLWLPTNRLPVLSNCKHLLRAIGDQQKSFQKFRCMEQTPKCIFWYSTVKKKKSVLGTSLAWRTPPRERHLQLLDADWCMGASSPSPSGERWCTGTWGRALTLPGAGCAVAWTGLTPAASPWKGWKEMTFEVSDKHTVSTIFSKCSVNIISEQLTDASTEWAVWI